MNTLDKLELLSVVGKIERKLNSLVRENESPEALRIKHSMYFFFKDLKTKLKEKQ